MKLIKTIVSVILLDSTYGSLRTRNKNKDETASSANDLLVQRSLNQDELLDGWSIPANDGWSVAPSLLEDENESACRKVFEDKNITNFGDNDLVPIVIRVKEGSWTEGFSRLQEICNESGCHIGIAIERVGILSATIPKKEICSLQNDPTIEKVNIDSQGSEHVKDETMKGNHRKLDMSNEQPYGISMVLQNTGFWENLAEPTGTIKICIADTGYDLGHDDLPEGDDVIGTNNPEHPDETWSTDENGDGTKMAGVIAATGRSSYGLAGIIPNNYGGKFQLVIANAAGSDGSASYSQLIEAVETCIENGAKVVSLSLEYSQACPIAEEYFNDLYENNDILLVASAGYQIGLFAEFGLQTEHVYPSSFSSTISVGAIDQNEELAEFSSSSDQVELVAPGVDIETTFPGNLHEIFSGTSMATPHVAGVAGLLWMYFPECKNYQIRNVIAKTAKQLDNLCCNSHTGHGLVQAKDAYDLLSEGNCGGDIGEISVGGCGQLSQSDTSDSSSCVPWPDHSTGGGDDESDVLEYDERMEEVPDWYEGDDWENDRPDWYKCNTAIPYAHYYMKNGECWTSGHCCSEEFCCKSFVCGSTWTCQSPKFQKGEHCGKDNECETGRCWWTWGTGAGTGQLALICWDPPTLQIGDPCERGADCVTDVCSAATHTCTNACSKSNEDYEHAYSTGRCTETERCGNELHSSPPGACAPKFEIGEECDNDDDCLSGSCRGDHWGKICRISSPLPTGEQCIDDTDCISDICNLETQLCVNSCESGDCGDAEYCKTYTDSNHVGKSYCTRQKEIGEECSGNLSCKSDYCARASRYQELKCTEKKAGGTRCYSDSECVSNECVSEGYMSRCKYAPDEQKALGEDCSGAYECQSERCDGTYNDKTCRGPKVGLGESCVDTYDCEGDSYTMRTECNSNTCKKRCSSNIECPATQHCDRTKANYRYTCEPKLGVDASCRYDEDCDSGRCDRSNYSNRTCKAKLDIGGSCRYDSDCVTEYCKSRTCSAKAQNGEACRYDTNCISNSCYKPNYYSGTCHDPNGPSNSPTPQPTRYPTNPPTTPAPTTSTQPSGEGGRIVPREGQRCRYTDKDLGTDFSNVEECIETAREDPDCTGSDVIWNNIYPQYLGCKCCRNHETCPVPESDYYASSTWTSYEYEQPCTDTNSDPTSEEEPANPNQQKLAGGEACLFDNDCLSNSCVRISALGSNRCELTSEELKDTWEDCVYPEQCESGRCRGTTCSNGSCRGVDKECRPPKAGDGASCKEYDDCNSNYCNSNTCKTRCTSSDDCDQDTQHCSRSTYTCDAKLELGGNCRNDEDCVSNRCQSRSCSTKAQSGESCFDNNDCISDMCDKSGWPYKCYDPNAPTISPTVQLSTLPTTFPTTSAPTYEWWNELENFVGFWCKHTKRNLSMHNRLHYSTEILNVGQCIEAAKADPFCTGNEIYWERRLQGPYDHFCVCCSEFTTCPAPEEEYQMGASVFGSTAVTGFALLLHTYRYDSCKAYSNVSKPNAMCIHTSKEVKNVGVDGVLRGSARGGAGIFDTPEECMEAARNDPACDGNEIMWSPSFGSVHCECCSKHPTCPPTEDRYRPSGTYHVFKYKDCDDATTTNAPTDTFSNNYDTTTDVPTEYSSGTTTDPRDTTTDVPTLTDNSTISPVV